MTSFFSAESKIEYTPNSPANWLAVFSSLRTSITPLRLNSELYCFLDRADWATLNLEAISLERGPNL